MTEASEAKSLAVGFSDAMQRFEAEGRVIILDRFWSRPPATLRSLRYPPLWTVPAR